MSATFSDFVCFCPFFHALSELGKTGTLHTGRISSGDFYRRFSRMKLALHKNKC